MTVLLAEDDAASRQVIARMLEELGHRVLLAYDAGKAIDTVRRANRVGSVVRPQIVIVNWRLPDMDGVELVRRLRTESRVQDASAAVRGDYFYILSMRSPGGADATAALAAGADDSLTVPFDRGELAARLRVAERIVLLKRRISGHRSELARAYKRIRDDVDAAARYQRSLLPTAPPRVADLDIAWRYLPYDDLAGDLFNVFRFDDTRVGVFILDVTGHGVAAALAAMDQTRVLQPSGNQFSVLLTHLDGAARFKLTAPHKVAEHLNSRLQIGNSTERFLSLWYGILDTVSGQLRYTSAGNAGIAVVSRGRQPRSLMAPSFPIGFTDRPEYRDRVVQLARGDRVYLFTDGLFEAQNGRHEAFGMRRTLRALKDAEPYALDESLDHAIRAAQEWCGASVFDDDVSLLGFALRERPQRAAAPAQRATAPASLQHGSGGNGGVLDLDPLLVDQP